MIAPGTTIHPCGVDMTHAEVRRVTDVQCPPYESCEAKLEWGRR